MNCRACSCNFLILRFSLKADFTFMGFTLNTIAIKELYDSLRAILRILVDLPLMYNASIRIDHN